MKKLYKVFGLLALLTAAVAGAGSLYSWSSGETLSASQLNANFAHIHNNMVGGHGARLVDADVSTTANISPTKVGNGNAFARAWVTVSACSSDPCTILDSYNVTSVSRTSSGLYVIHITTALGDSTFGVIVTGKDQAGPRYCQGDPTSTSSATVTCYNLVPAASDTGFTAVIFDT